MTDSAELDRQLVDAMNALKNSRGEAGNTIPELIRRIVLDEVKRRKWRAK